MLTALRSSAVDTLCAAADFAGAAAGLRALLQALRGRGRLWLCERALLAGRGERREQRQTGDPLLRFHDFSPSQHQRTRTR